jgi:hypothetical protein
MPTPALGSVAGIALQATQSDAFSAIQDDVLLSSSLWVNIALAGLSILLFVYMGRDIETGRARLIWGATLMIPLVSISSYLGLLSGLTVGFIEMPTGHALAGEEVMSQWGRYLTWALSTPMILLALGKLADVDDGSLFTVIAADVGMCVTGLAAALVTSSLAVRWAFYVISCAFFLVVLYALLTEWPVAAAEAGRAVARLPDHLGARRRGARRRAVRRRHLVGVLRAGRSREVRVRVPPAALGGCERADRCDGLDGAGWRRESGRRLDATAVAAFFDCVDGHCRCRRHDTVFGPSAATALPVAAGVR